MTPVLVVWQPCADAPERAVRYIRENGLVAVVPQLVHDGPDWAVHAEKLLDVCEMIVVLWDPHGDAFRSSDPLYASAKALNVPIEDEYLPDPVDRPGFVRRLARWV